MSSRTRHLVIVAAATVLAAQAASGQSFPVAANCTAAMNPGVAAASIFVVPDGNGTQLVAAYGPGGVAVDATIMVTLIDASGLPAAGVSNQDVRLEEVGSAMSWCANAWYPPPSPGPNCADVASNAAGQTRFSLAYHGGGSQFGGCRVFVLEANGVFAPIPGVLPIHMNSADITGDLVVNLSDIALFAQDLGAAIPPYRSDFNWDGQVNLSDLVLFAQSLAANCP